MVEIGSNVIAIIIIGVVFGPWCRFLCAFSSDAEKKTNFGLS